MAVPHPVMAQNYSSVNIFLFSLCFKGLLYSCEFILSEIEIPKNISHVRHLERREVLQLSYANNNHSAFMPVKGAMNRSLLLMRGFK